MLVSTITFTGRQRMTEVKKPSCFQDLILKLHEFWSKQGCTILQPYDIEMGAGTFHPGTTLRALGTEPWNAAFVQPSRRPTDSRYGENPNRLQQHHQYQIIMKPSPPNFQDLYLQSLKAIGLDPSLHDIRFVEDDWESPTLGAWGLGWEVWCDGMEITQFTYFQQMGGIECSPVSGEITFGLERLALYIFNMESVYDLPFNPPDSEYPKTYGDVFHRAEQEHSAYNFEFANTDILMQQFKDAETQCAFLLKAESSHGSLKGRQGLALPAYEQCLKASHLFNLMDARGVISVVERQAYIARVRNLAKACCECWLGIPAVQLQQEAA